MLHLEQTQKGVTLTEVLVIVVILGILALMIAPAYFTYFAQNRLISASEGLYNDIVFARTSAIKQQVNVTLVFQTGSSWCYGITTSSTCDCNTSASCNLGQTNSTDFKNVSLSITGFAGNVTLFDRTRAVPSTIGTATFTSTSGESITVSLNPLGLPKICANGVGGYAAC